MGLSGKHNQTYDQILEYSRIRNSNLQNRTSRGNSANKSGNKKRRNKMNLSHNGIMGSIKESNLASENGR